MYLAQYDSVNVNFVVQAVIKSSQSAQRSGLEKDSTAVSATEMPLSFVDLTQIDQEARVRLSHCALLATAAVCVVLQHITLSIAQAI